MTRIELISAIIVVNRDTEERQVMINESGDEQIFMLEPEESLNDICEAGCMIASGDEDAVEVDGQGVMAIVDGKLVREQ